MRPKHPPRWSPQGLRPVAKRVPTVQRRCARTCLNLLGGAQSSVHSRESGNPGQRWVPAFAGTNGGENLEAPRIKTETLFASPSASRAFHNRVSEFHKRKAAGWGPGGSRTSAIVSGGWECDRRR